MKFDRYEEEKWFIIELLMDKTLEEIYKNILILKEKYERKYSY